MKTGIRAKQWIIYALLLVAALGYLAYTFFISTNLETIKQIDSAIAKLHTDIAALETYYVHKDLYLTNIEENNKNLAIEVDKNLNDLNDKDLVAYLEYLDDKYHMSTPAASFADTEYQDKIIYVFDTSREDIRMMERGLNITYDVKYGQLKEFLTEIKESDLHPYLTNVTASLDLSTGSISGVISLKARAAEGSLKEDIMYTEYPVDISNVQQGVRNLFGNYSENPVERVNQVNPQNNITNAPVEETP